MPAIYYEWLLWHLIEWGPASLVIFVNLLPKADFVDLGAVESALLFLVGDWSSCFCFFNALNDVIFIIVFITICLSYWISPNFESRIFRGCRKFSGICANCLCWSLVTDIGLDQFGPFLFINASPRCFCCWREQTGWWDHHNWSKRNWVQAFHWLLVCGWFFLCLLSIDAIPRFPHPLNGGMSAVCLFLELIFCDDVMDSCHHTVILHEKLYQTWVDNLDLGGGAISIHLNPQQPTVWSVACWF